MTRDDIMTTASHYSEVDAQGYVKFCEDDLINFSQAVLARAIAQPVEQTRAHADTPRLDFLIDYDARVARSRDGDVWHVGRFEDAEGDLEWCRLGPTCDTPREAIDAAMTVARPASGETE